MSCTDVSCRHCAASTIIAASTLHPPAGLGCCSHDLWVPGNSFCSRHPCSAHAGGSSHPVSSPGEHTSFTSVRPAELSASPANPPGRPWRCGRVGAVSSGVHMLVTRLTREIALWRAYLRRFRTDWCLLPTLMQRRAQALPSRAAASLAARCSKVFVPAMKRAYVSVWKHAQLAFVCVSDNSMDPSHLERSTFWQMRLRRAAPLQRPAGYLDVPMPKLVWAGSGQLWGSLGPCQVKGLLCRHA